MFEVSDWFSWFREPRNRRYKHVRDVDHTTHIETYKSEYPHIPSADILNVIFATYNQYIWIYI